MNINDKLSKLSPEETKLFREKLLEILESPEDYPKIYAVHKINKINPNSALVEEILYKKMFEEKTSVY